jgi:hypothetical protein
MRRKLYPINILSRARRITSAWEQIGTTVKIGSVTNAAFLADIAQAGLIEDQIRSAEIHLAALRNQRDAQYLSLWDKVKRVYDGVKCNYGDDSTQYEMVGRKRASKRKHRSRKPMA